MLGDRCEGVRGIDCVLPSRLEGVDGSADMLDPNDSCLCTESNRCRSLDGESKTAPELCDLASILAALGLANVPDSNVPPGDTAAYSAAKSRGDDEDGVVGSVGRTDLGGVEGASRAELLPLIFALGGGVLGLSTSLVSSVDRIEAALVVCFRVDLRDGAGTRDSGMLALFLFFSPCKLTASSLAGCTFLLGDGSSATISPSPSPS